jgi:dihydrofolate reductase/thymidylate synthase
MFKRFNIIAAVDKFYGIGINNRLPWKKLKYDMQYFQNITTSNLPFKQNAVIMGRNTWESIPHKYRPLPNRKNIVISSTLADGGNATVKASLDSALECCNDVDDIYVIGGSQLYKEALGHPGLENLYLTHIDKEYNCDTFFPITDDIIKNDFNVIKEDIVNPTTHELVDNQLSFNKYKKKLNGEVQYLNLLNKILKYGDKRMTRNATTLSLFGESLKFDCSKGFPLLTTKKVFFRGIVEELLFFLKGDTNSKILSNKKVKIWDLNTNRKFLDDRGLKHYEEGDMGPMYGWNWRHFGATYKGMDHDYINQGYDQLQNVIKLIKEDPTSRRIMMTTFDPSKIDESVLAPCHGLIVQFYVRDGKLDLNMYQRSVDTFLGLPFNIASYALLLHVISKITNYRPGVMTFSLGDIHVYESHIKAIKTQLARTPYHLPELVINKDVINLEDLEYGDFELKNYKCHPGIKAKMIA